MDRVRRSQSNLIARECIVTALLQLTHEKPLSAITISELTLRAGVSRVTFYRNYTSKEEVLIAELEDLFAAYQEDDLRTIRQGIYYDRQHMTHCFSYLYQYRSFMDGLMRCGFGDLFLRRLTKFVYEKWGGDPDDRAERYRLVAFSGLLYSIYTEWVRRECEETPEQLADLIEKMCETGFYEKRTGTQDGKRACVQWIKMNSRSGKPYQL